MAEIAIGDVARMSGVTARTLRHYESIGLLLPSSVADTGYRYYGDAPSGSCRSTEGTDR